MSSAACVIRKQVTDSLCQRRWLRSLRYTLGLRLQDNFKFNELWFKRIKSLRARVSNELRVYEVKTP